MLPIELENFRISIPLVYIFLSITWASLIKRNEIFKKRELKKEAIDRTEQSIKDITGFVLVTYSIILTSKGEAASAVLNPLYPLSAALILSFASFAFIQNKTRYIYSYAGKLLRNAAILYIIGGFSLILLNSSGLISNIFDTFLTILFIYFLYYSIKEVDLIW